MCLYYVSVSNHDQFYTEFYQFRTEELNNVLFGVICHEGVENLLIENSIQGIQKEFLDFEKINDICRSINCRGPGFSSKLNISLQ